LGIQRRIPVPAGIANSIMASSVLFCYGLFSSKFGKILGKCRELARKVPTSQRQFSAAMRARDQLQVSIK
jgi:hypothetical protein